jgi:hypothetical protein
VFDPTLSGTIMIGCPCSDISKEAASKVQGYDTVVLRGLRPSTGYDPEQIQSTARSGSAGLAYFSSNNTLAEYREIEKKNTNPDLQYH